MPYPPGHRTQTRLRILRSAQTLFNRRGFEAVSIAEVMKHAGLTHGGFYRYFRAKSELYAEALTLVLSEPPSRRWEGVDIDFASTDAALHVVKAYLSRQHYEDIDGSCPMVALPSDVSRSDRSVKRAFETVFLAMAQIFERSLTRNGRAERKRAIAIASLCVGGMVVARGVGDRKLADEIRAAATSFAFQLGAWQPRAG